MHFFFKTSCPVHNLLCPSGAAADRNAVSCDTSVSEILLPHKYNVFIFGVYQKHKFKLL